MRSKKSLLKPVSPPTSTVASLPSNARHEVGADPLDCVRCRLRDHHGAAEPQSVTPGQPYADGLAAAARNAF